MNKENKPWKQENWITIQQIFGGNEPHFFFFQSEMIVNNNLIILTEHWAPK